MRGGPKSSIATVGRKIQKGDYPQEIVYSLSYSPYSPNNGKKKKNFKKGETDEQTHPLIPGRRYKNLEREKND